MRSLVLAWTVIGLVSAVACSSSHERSDAGAVIESVDDWARALVAERCRRLFRCPLPVESERTSTFLWGDEAHCIAVQEKAIEAGSLLTSDARLSQLRRIEAEGLIHIDPESARACQAAMMDCSVLGTEAGACKHVIKGDAPMGGACELSVECEGDAYCGSNSCPGTCVPKKSVGEACESSIECTGEELVDCLRRDGELETRCTALESGTASGEGERCTIGGASFVACPPGLWCQTIAPDVHSGTCQQPIAIGEPCRWRVDVCEAGALCLGGRSDMQCRKGTPIAARQTVDAKAETRLCGISDTGRYCDLSNGWECVDGVCEQINNPGAESSPCRVADVDIGVCDPGLYCDDNQCWEGGAAVSCR